jgi:hypothetical protein
MNANSRRPLVVELPDPVVIEMLKTKSPEDRMAMGSAAFRFARNMVRERLRREHPAATESELDRLVVERLHGNR